MQLSRRPVEAGDEAFLRDLIIATTAEQLMASAWPEPMRSNLLDMQYRARLNGVRGSYPSAVEELAMLDGNPVAWIVVERNAASIHLVDIQVVPEKRGSGIGSALIGELLNEASRTGIPVRLIVSIMNTGALRLYDRLGFVRTGGDEVQHVMTYSPAI